VHTPGLATLPCRTSSVTHQESHDHDAPTPLDHHAPFLDKHALLSTVACTLSPSRALFLHRQRRPGRRTSPIIAPSPRLEPSHHPGNDSIPARAPPRVLAPLQHGRAATAAIRRRAAGRFTTLSPCSRKRRSGPSRHQAPSRGPISQATTPRPHRP
jgi:hypothetical protein